MSARVLLNLSNELGKRDKMRGLPSILSLFRDELIKINNKRAQMLDSSYHMTLTLIKNLILSCLYRLSVMIHRESYMSAHVLLNLLNEF